MATRKTIFDDLRAYCLSLPDTKETPTWGKPHFRVGEKIFAGFDDEGGAPSAGMKLEKEHADDLVQNDERVTRAPYVGHKGWVSIDLSRFDDRAQLRDLILESYRLIAPKKSLAKLGTPAAKTPASKKKPARKK
ncbi:MAG TPA: MmcQ/YjbR family DNA-binding protein [Thermoanaerobaculia bacterium]|nr:MmcQ/YjbR family DNA-binding protein [Thermoanaerobaculia bacterium]